MFFRRDGKRGFADVLLRPILDPFPESDLDLDNLCKCCWRHKYYKKY